MEKFKLALFYFDAQNLFRRSKAVFSDIIYPNFDPIALSNLIAQKHSLQIKKIRFYTGVPPKKRNPMWNKFWSKKLAILGKNPLVTTFTRKTQLTEKEVLIKGKKQKAD